MDYDWEPSTSIVARYRNLPSTSHFPLSTISLGGAADLRAGRGPRPLLDGHGQTFIRQNMFIQLCQA